MDFYNLQESDHRLIEKTMSLPSDSQQYKNYLFRHLFSKGFSTGFSQKKFLDKKNILLMEEDPRLQCVIKNLLLEANNEAVCGIVEGIDDIICALETRPYDLVIANYYLSEDEIDYEYWERIHAIYPQMEVIIFSHVNDKEYYNTLEKVANLELGPRHLPWSSRLGHFFKNIFGG
ncbi:MAG TPA: hypothetical protein VIG33_10250 [Pseudobdellovibrionaceae bacterium]